MKNKKPLIILAIILLLALLGLVFYAFQISQPQPEKKVTSPIAQKEKSTTESKDKIKNPELEKIKKNIEEINNETFQQQELIDEDCTGCTSSEEIKDYQEKVISGKVVVAQGEITEVAKDYLKVNFKQDLMNWTSKVIITSDTSVFVLDESHSISVPFSFSDLELGDTVVVKTEQGKVIDASFEASSIHKVK